jgi:hypothetical protein
MECLIKNNIMDALSYKETKSASKATVTKNGLL